MPAADQGKSPARAHRGGRAREGEELSAVRAIVFDFDGVIANSEPLHFQAFRDTLAGEGLALAESDYYERYLGYNDARAFREIGLERGRQWTDEFIAALIARKAEVTAALEARGSILFPGARAAIVRLAAACPLAIASGALRVEIDRTLAKEGLAHLFGAIVAADDGGASKPAPDPYLHAVQRLSTAARLAPPLSPADCVAIEDSPWGLESARAAGLRTIGVTHTYPAPALQGADRVVPDLDALTWALACSL